MTVYQTLSVKKISVNDFLRWIYSLTTLLELEDYFTVCSHIRQNNSYTVHKLTHGSKLYNVMSNQQLFCLLAKV